MKGKFKKLILFTALLFAFILKVNAAGSVNVTLSGSNTVTVNAEYTISVNVSNVVTDISDKKVYAVAGFVQFDPEYFQFVSATGSNGFTATMNNSTYKMALIDMMMSTGASSGTIGTIKLKAIKTGSTSITINSASSTDYDNNNLQVNITPKSVTIEEAKSSNSKLASLEVVGHTLSPVFNANTKSYTVTVPEDTTSVQINATKADQKATLTLPGTNGLVTLSGNSTNATVKVTAENGSSTNYVVTINKETHTEPQPTEKGTDATLKYLDVSGFSLNPVFTPDGTNYSMRVNNNITALNVTATPNDPKATVQISGHSGWVVGNNTITIKVTAEDGVTIKNYYVNVTRAAANVKSSDTNIDLRILSTHTMEPVFNNSINEYEVVVPEEVTKLDMTITPYDKKTNVTVSGNENFVIGNGNAVTIKVVAEDGTSKTVILKVTRTEDKASADLIDLRVVGHTLDPEFKPEITEYKVNVGSKENELNLIVKVAEDSTYEVTGNKDFKAGKNVVLIKVTDKKGFIKYYQIEVNKASKKALTFFGFPLIPFIIFLLLFLLLLFLLLLLLRRRKEEKEEEVVEPKPTTPLNIEFKPEFNFGSKNGTDDDVFYSSGGPINNGSSNSASTEPKKIENVKEAEYDIYDDVVTKDELVDALNESLETNNADKLKMLLDQENLNRQKEALRQQEQNKDRE